MIVTEEQAQKAFEFLSRKEAISIGLSTYFTGKPCPKGHLDKRSVGGRACVECSRINARKWQMENPGRASLANKIYRQTNKKKINKQSKLWRDKNRGWTREYARNYWAKNIENRIFLSAKMRAKRDRIDFNITLDDIHIPEYCPALGIPLKKEIGIEKKVGPTDNSPSIDRIIHDLGYVKGNIIIISNKANRAKNNLTIQEMRKLVSFYEGLFK